jgi:hypothetical protein
MVLNFMTLKMRVFSPGFGWKKKGVPSFIKIKVINKNIGLSKSKNVIAKRMSIKGLKKFL